ncbi:hypothetical protein [Arcobacter cloacae]|uniref:Uncharacterized protein n=1 Tax=Arcobacter cloacae TaxID=1054034 RepID=A0A6M8NQK2_9BACT|nr:hypothetical protein [Arcobacter cloacae]QKF88646.1 hypothetical protein ACLO_0102 [Arcobacter cloacae]RXI41610.1 hypothetical protein CP963_05750 [Arcobacter cloacae]
MENQKDYKSSISSDINKIINETEILINKYNKFFNIEEIFSSENGGKTRLNRQIFNENHEEIQASILEIALCLDEIKGYISEEIKMILSKYNLFDKIEITDLIFDDRNFLELLFLDLETHGIKGEIRVRCLNDVNELLSLKNKIFNLKYFVDMFNTSIFDKYLNRLGVEDLINSTIIFETIDSYGLQFEELLKFSKEIKNLEPQREKLTNLNSLNSLLELHKRRADNYHYASIRYKIYVEYNCDILAKPMYVNKAYLENIVSSLMEQSYMDLVKKELKKGKIQKQVDVNVSVVKNTFQITIKNNGFESRNIQSLYNADIDNKYILEAKNFAAAINAKFDIQTLDNEGMLYTLSVKLKA